MPDRSSVHSFTFFAIYYEVYVDGMISSTPCCHSITELVSSKERRTESVMVPSLLYRASSPLPQIPGGVALLVLAVFVPISIKSWAFMLLLVV